MDYIFYENYFDYIIVEADGSKMKPIKAPRKGEPLIPRSTSIVIGVVGLDAFGKPIDKETVHRVEQFLEVTEGKPGETIDEAAIVNLVLHEKGLFKNAEGMKKYLLLNKADNEELVSVAAAIKRELGKRADLESVLVARLKAGEIWA